MRTPNTYGLFYVFLLSAVFPQINARKDYCTINIVCSELSCDISIVKLSKHICQFFSFYVSIYSTKSVCVFTLLTSSVKTEFQKLQKQVNLTTAPPCPPFHPLHKYSQAHLPVLIEMHNISNLYAVTQQMEHEFQD